MVRLTVHPNVLSGGNLNYKVWYGALLWCCKAGCGSDVFGIMWCGMVWVGIVLNGYGSDVYSLLGASITKFGTMPLKHHSVYLMLAMMMMMLVVSLISMKRLLHPLPSV